MRRLTGGRDPRHMTKFVLGPHATDLFGFMASTTSFLRGLYQQSLGLRGVVNRVARQAAEMSLNVRLTDLCFVTPTTTGQDHFGLDAAVAVDEFGIARTGMLGAWPVASFAAPGRRVLAFESLGMGRLDERLGDFLMAPLAYLHAYVLGILVGVRLRIPSERRPGDEGEAP